MTKKLDKLRFDRLRSDIAGGIYDKVYYMYFSFPFAIQGMEQYMHIHLQYKKEHFEYHSKRLGQFRLADVAVQNALFTALRQYEF